MDTAAVVGLYTVVVAGCGFAVGWLMAERRR